MWGLYWGILAWGHGSTAWTSAVSKWFITWHLDQTCLSWIYWLLQTKPRTEWKPIKRFQFNSGLPCHIEKNNLFRKFGVYLFVNQKKHLSWLELLVVLLDWNLMGLQVWEKEKFLSEKEKRTIAKLSLQDSWFLSNV